MKRLWAFSKNRRPQRGDTIIEILITTAVFTVVLVVAYSTSTHSLQETTDAGNRDRATAYGQSQLEVIRSAANNPDVHALDPYIATSGQPFCVTSSGSIDTADINPSQKLCGITERGPTTTDKASFKMALTYNPATNVFKADMRWPGPNGIDSQGVFYYKIPGGSGGGLSVTTGSIGSWSWDGSTTNCCWSASVGGTVNTNGASAHCYVAYEAKSDYDLYGLDPAKAPSYDTYTCGIPDPVNVSSDTPIHGVIGGHPSRSISSCQRVAYEVFLASQAGGIAFDRATSVPGQPACV